MVSNNIYDVQRQVNVMSYNIAEYVTRWRFNLQQDVETMTDLSQTVFIRPNNYVFKRTHTHTNTHTHTHTLIRTQTSTNAIGENAIRCISLKIRS